MKAKILCENSVFRSKNAIAEQGWMLLAEHGWSVFLEMDEGNYLFDTGLGLAIINNARALNINLPTIKGIFLSHHHIDHTGGLFAVLNSIKKNVPVYAHPELFKKSYMEYKDQLIEVGIKHNRKQLEAMGAEFIFNKRVREVIPGVYLTGEVPRLTDYEKGDKDLVVKAEEGFIVDPVMDDQSLVVKTNQGLFIILGCAHSGIINTIEYAIKITGEERIHTIIGGTHLGPVTDEQRNKSIKALKQYNIKRIGVSHCTGLYASALMAQEFGSRFFNCNVGTTVSI